MKLTLIHKGLLLVSIPVCFEIGMFSVLIGLQDQVEREAQRLADLVVARVGIHSEQRLGAHDHAVQAVTALRGLGLDETLLNRMRYASACKTFEGHDPAILGEAKVAFVPGEAFGTPGYARFSFAMADADMEEGIRRIAAFVGA